MASNGAEPTRLNERPVTPERIDRLHVTKRGAVLADTLRGIGSPALPLPPLAEGAAPGCDVVASRTSSNFQPGTYVAQAGFSEREYFAAHYQLAPSAFPIRVSLIEALFAAVATTEETTTQFTVTVWDGFPDTGIEVFSFSSDDVLVPHVRVAQGNAATQLQFSIDPGDPEQIIVSNASGTGVFSIGVRIDVHNEQTADPCFTAPPSARNNFPVTDNTQSVCGNYNQLNFPSANWLFGVNCGPNGCPGIPSNQVPQPPGAWSRFSGLLADVNVLGFCVTGCRPRGDWVLRATYNSVACQPGTGACCLPTGGCDVRLVDDCALAGGAYQGDGTTCAGINCPQPTGACCFGTGCIALTEADCGTAGGTYLGNGTACQGSTCPTGACCLPNGSCVVATSQSCTAQSGVFRGVGTACGNANCPPPTGACCLSNGGCLELTSTNCGIIPGSRFAGGGTTCATGCVPPCRPDFDGNGILNPDDLSDYISCYFNPPCGQADYNADTFVNPDDLSDYITDYFQGC
jgi:hypothetical protein